MPHLYFNSCPDYYPTDFNSTSYQQNLDNLLSSDGTLSVNKHSFKRIGWQERIFNAVSWLFGFKDLTNSTKINGEILKFIHYGVLHNIINATHQNQFQYLSSQSWIAPEVKVSINILKDNNESPIKMQLIREQLEKYFDHNKKQLLPCFWKRMTTFPIVPDDKSSHFGTSHLFKATSLTKPGMHKKALNNITWAVNSMNEDLDYEKKCYKLLDLELDRTPSLHHYAHHLLPFIYNLAKNCILKENDFDSAEKFIAKAIHHFGNVRILTWLRKKIYFKQKKWDKLTHCVKEFTKKLERNESKKKSHELLAEESRGIAAIYRLDNRRLDAIEFLKKVMEYDPEDQSTRKEISSIYQSFATEAPSTEVRIRINFLEKAIQFEPENLALVEIITSEFKTLANYAKNSDLAIESLLKALKYSPEDQSLKRLIASHYVIIGNTILKENGSLLGMTGSFLKLRESKSPKMYFENAFSLCPELEGSHIQWLISNLEQQKDFKGALKFYKAISEAHPKYEYKLQFCYQHGLLEKNKNLANAYDLFILGHKFDSKNFKIKEEIVSAGFKLAKLHQKEASTKALKYLKEIFPLVREIVSDLDSTFGVNAPLPKINEEDVRELLSEIYYQHALKLVDQCRHSFLALKDDNLFIQHKEDNQDQIQKVVKWLQKSLEANPNLAKAHFDLANLAEYFDVEGVNIKEHLQRAVKLNQVNFYYLFRLAEIENKEGKNGNRANLPITTEFKLNIPKGFCIPNGSSLKYMNWFQNQFIVNEDKLYSIDPHSMCMEKF